VTNTHEELLSQLLLEEEALQFDAFTQDTALSLGFMLIERARERGEAVTVDIRLGEQQVFHYAFPGTSADNDDWVLRKSRTTSRFGRSTYYVETELRIIGQTLQQRYFLDPALYAPYNGAFPIRARGFGVIGTVTVSGLPGDGDHRLVTDTIRDYLAMQEK